VLENAKKIYLGEGKPPPKGGFKRLFNTPEGPFPKLVDVAQLYGMYKSNISRRYSNQRENDTDWYIIENPTEEQSNQAIDNANMMYVAKYAAEDHCTLCNLVDDLIFPEDCWLIKVDHKHSVDELGYDVYNAMIHYCYAKKDYRVRYEDWILGVRPHLTGG